MILTFNLFFDFPVAAGFPRSHHKCSKQVLNMRLNMIYDGFADTTATASTESWTSITPAESTVQKATPRTGLTPNTAFTQSTALPPTTRTANHPGTTATIRTGRWSTGRARPTSTRLTTEAHPNRSGAAARHSALLSARF